jgi:hypothetical protein
LKTPKTKTAWSPFRARQHILADEKYKYLYSVVVVGFSATENLVLVRKAVEKK